MVRLGKETYHFPKSSLNHHELGLSSSPSTVNHEPTIYKYYLQISPTINPPFPLHVPAAHGVQMHLRHLGSQGASAQQDVPLQRHRQEGLRRGEARWRWGRGEGTGKKWWVPCGFSWALMGYKHKDSCFHGFEWDVTNKNLDFIGFEWVFMGCKPGKLWISFLFENVFHGFEWNIMQCNQDSIMDSDMGFR